MKLVVILAVVVMFLLPTTADANCRTHKCWHTVHVHRLERMVERKIDAITPYKCGPERSVVPCYIINHESSMCGYWLALNGCHQSSNRIPCATRACGMYQFLGWKVPWPVIVRSVYQTLKNKLAHHRMARRLWGQQSAGAACHWCY